MTSIHTNATDWLQQLTSGKCTSREITQLYLDQINQYDSTIQAFLQVDGESALEPVSYTHLTLPTNREV